MAKRNFKINLSWTVAVIAIIAMLWPTVMPDQLTMHPSGRLIVWPAFAISGALMVLWLWAWAASLKSKAVSGPLALLSFLMTALPLYATFAQSWGCLRSVCFW